MPRVRTFAALISGLAIALSLSGQTTTGNLYVRVLDEQGGVMPGVTATLSGCGAPQTTTTGSQGEFHFLNLAPCTYALRTELDGFATVERGNVVVNVGANTELSIAMNVASVSTTVTVSSESPLLDTRRQVSGTTFTNAELRSIPTSRDPWVMLQQTPGVLVDRQNVGGSEAGGQSAYVGKGTDPTQNAWNLDGVAITDMVGAGASTTYYDFDSFEQMEMSTGGADPTIAVPGVTINLVTKRGTNEVHGSARIFETPGELQARPATVFNGRSNVVDHIDDYGTDAGGPLWPDRAWLWGSYGKQLIDKHVSGISDKTSLENFAGKLNLQAIESNSFTLFYFRGDKQVSGRGAGPNRPLETTADQRGPTTIWKGDDSQVFGSSLVASANWSWMDAGYTFSPKGGVGPSGPDVYVDPQGVWHNSYKFYRTTRPQHQANANLSAFFSTGTIGHELKFGFGYRKYGVGSLSVWPGQGNIGYENYGIAKLTRPATVNYEGRYFDAFLSDTVTLDRLTVNVGVRWDEQESRNLSSNIPANPAFPDFLPAVTYAGSGYLVSLQDWQPRVGATYALGAKKTTLLRGSYARFADQMGAWSAVFENAMGYQYLYYYWTDGNGNHRPDPGELGAFYGSYNVDPSNPGQQTPLNRISSKLKNTTTDELMAGIDHQILPEFVAGLTYTYRHRKNFTWTPYTQLTSANYSLFKAGYPAYDQHGNPIGTSGPLYACTLNGLACGNPASGFNFGTTLENRPGYTTNYQAVELSLTKRLSHRWMAHGSFTWTDWKQHIDDKATGCQDPTDTLSRNGDSCDDAIVYYGSAMGNVFINAKWAFNVSALYQLPLNFNLGANFYGRQGYALPFYVRKNPGDGLGARRILVGAPDDHRNPSLFQLDLRAEKVIPLFQKADLTLSVDLFNALNRHTILQQQVNATAGSAGTGGNNAQAGQVFEVQYPRIVRFGARLSF